jgi:hypothetical protein
MMSPSDICKVQELMLPADDPDHVGHLRVFQYRFRAVSERQSILEGMRQFELGEREDLVSTRFRNCTVHNTLRMLIEEFLSRLSAIEQVRGRRFKFSDCSIMNRIYAAAFLVFNSNIE